MAKPGPTSQAAIMAGVKDPEAMLDEDQILFLDFLCGDKTHGDSQAQFAESTGVKPRQLTKWKRNFPAFTRAWHQRMIEGAGNPEYLDAQLAHLREIATDADRHSDRIKAIELYWKLVDRMSPDVLEVRAAEAKVVEMTDQELEVLEADYVQKTAAGVAHLKELKSGTKSE